MNERTREAEVRFAQFKQRLEDLCSELNVSLHLTMDYDQPALEVHDLGTGFRKEYTSL